MLRVQECYKALRPLPCVSHCFPPLHTTMSRKYPNNRTSPRTTRDGRRDRDTIINNSFGQLTIYHGVINGGHMVNSGSTVLAPNHGSIVQNTYNNPQVAQSSSSGTANSSTDSTTTSQGALAPLATPSSPAGEGNRDSSAEPRPAHSSIHRSQRSASGARRRGSRSIASRKNHR
ncbi:hypothetical protein CC2G_008506 [Coprinopsis cinerea AmutBmut pab1-1]|nr:hypothetical protein CC2G_008506 [Coprinopsis cinerea AmutBmut pab1-1]